ncbi:uncharacterized protein [Leuresthes tenuis]|uniref:uncharacterized protein isoform X1 n=1 Tax=Leuresthes tenuis TaxID=355514 RepID=UPI003B5029C6
MSVQLCLALLALSSLTAASDPGCDELTKPLEDRSKVYGKWIFQVLASDSEEMLKAVKISNSSWMAIQSPVPGSSDYNIRFADRIDGKCEHGTANSTTSGNSMKVTFYFNSTTYGHVGKFLETCPDCILWMDDEVTEGNGEPKKCKSLYLFTKTGKLDASQMEVFKKQAECLNITLDFYFPDTTDLCPEEKEAAEDVKTEEQ